MIRTGTKFLMMLGLFLMSLASPRVGNGDDDTRVWTPIAFMLIALVLVLRIPSLLKVNWRAALTPPTIIAFFYLAWLALTQSWSVDPSAGRIHIILLTMTLFAAISMQEERPWETTLWYCGFASVIIPACWLALAANWPGAVSPEDLTFRLRGIMAHEQLLLFLCLTSSLCLIVWYLNRRRANLPSYTPFVAAYLLMALVTGLATKGRSFTVYYVVTAAITVILAQKSAYRFFAIAVVAVLGTAVYFLQDSIVGAVSRGNEDTLSGRTTVWATTWGEIIKRPWTGYGFGTFQEYFIPFYGNWTPGHAHNMWLNTWFESGFPGMALMTLLTLSMMWRGYMFYRETGVLSYTFSISIFGLMSNITSTMTGTKLTTLFGIILLLFYQEECLLRNAKKSLQWRKAYGDALPTPA